MTRPILMVSEHWAPEGSGAEWSNLAWARGLERRNQRVKVLTPGHPSLSGLGGIGEPEIIRRLWPTWPAGWLRTRTPWWHAWTFVKTLRAVRAWRPRVIHVVGKGMLVGAWLAGKLTRTPVVFTLRDLNLLCPTGFRLLGGACDCSGKEWPACAVGYINAYHQDPGLRQVLGVMWARLNLRLQQRALRGCAVVTAVSRDLLDRHPVALTGKAVRRVTYTAPPETSEQPTRDEAEMLRRALRLPSDPIVLYVGKTSPGKGTETLLRAMRSVRERVPEAHLALAGPGGVGFPWCAEPWVHHLGPLPQRDVFALYRLASVVVVPSEWPEPFSRVLLEAMTFGCPVVATRVGGNPELVDHGISGLLVPPGDVDRLAQAIIALLEFPSLTLRADAAAEHVAECFNAERSLDVLLDVYAEARR